MNEPQITIVGNVGTHPELRRLPSGDAVVSFRVGVTQRRQNRETREWEDGATSWYQVSAFRALGENAHRSIHYGQRVVVSGRLVLREWETESKRGIAAELEAESLGPDLRFGTATFQKSGSVPSSPAAAAAPDAASTEGVDADGWAAPGAEREPVAVGDTPF